MEVWSDKTRENNALVEQFCRTRNPMIRDQVVERFLYLAQIVARRFQNRGLEYEDLYQVASLGIVRALDRFDCEKGVKFSSFLVPTLVGEIKNYFRDQSRLVRLPRRTSEALVRMGGIQSRLEQDLGRSPRPEELAEAMELDTEQVLALLESRRITSVASLEAQLSEDSDADISDWLGKTEEGYVQVENRQTVSAMMEMLSEPERQLMQLRYFDQLSQRQTAQRMGVSQMYISRMERRILERLRRFAAGIGNNTRQWEGGR